MVEEIKKYDKNRNLIYHKSSNGYEHWYENNNKIHYKNSNGFEIWYKYDNNNKQIVITKQEFENIKIKEYNSRTKCSRFELMDI
ncbi:MAG: hypothetical protein QQN64_06700 [Nitrosopumilus sp.]